MPELVGKNKVCFSADEVDEFNKTFPCSSLRSRSYWFEFDQSGNLIDTDVPEHDDGCAARALSEDAQIWLQDEKRTQMMIDMVKGSLSSKTSRLSKRVQ